MEDWGVPLIAAGGAIGGSAVTGLMAYRLARLDREGHERDELRVALVAYGAALDRLTLRVDQLPQAHGIEEDWTTRLVARWQSLDWLMGRLSVATIGRGLMRAIDEVISASNRLLVVAPEPVLASMKALSELIGRFDPRGSGWRKEWQEARTAVAQVSRGVMDTKRRGLVSRDMSRHP